MLEKLQKFITDAGIIHFSAKELVRHKNPNWEGPYLNIPPEHMWDHILKTLFLADTIRDELGEPITVVSGYRSRGYNTLVGGSKNSQHMRFRALDLQADNHLELVRLVCEYGQVFKDVGIGIYPSFCHIDVGYKQRFWTG